MKLRFVLLALVCVFSGCGARAQLQPVLPLARHGALPPPPETASPVNLALPEVDTFVLPCGMEVNIVTRPDSLVGSVAILAAGGHLGEVRIEDDLVLARMIEAESHAETDIDERGLHMEISALSDRVLERAVSVLHTLREPTFDLSDLVRSVNRLSTERARLGVRTTANTESNLIAQLFGPSSMHAARRDARRPTDGVNLPPVLARLATLSRPSHLVVVIVSARTSAEVRAALLGETSTWGEAPHVDAEALAAPVFPDVEAPMSHFRIVRSESRIFVVERGPSPFDPTSAAYRIAVRVFGGLHGASILVDAHEHTCRACGLHPAIVNEGAGYSMLSFGIELPHASVDAMLLRIDEEVHRIGQGEFAPGEIEAARAMELTLESSRFSSSSGIARSLLFARAEGQTLDVYARRYEAIRRASPVDIAEASRAWWRAQNLLMSVFSDHHIESRTTSMVQ